MFVSDRAAPVQAPQPRPVPTEMEIMLERLRSNEPALAPDPPPQTTITDIETMLQRLLPGTPTRAPWSRPVLARRDWATIVYLSCGKPGHGWAGAHCWMKHSLICCQDGRRRRWAPT